MAGIKEHEYLRTCAQLASCLSISIAAASKRIDIAAAKKGETDIASKKHMAEILLKEAMKLQSKDQLVIGNQLDSLLKALAEEENFLLED